MDEKQIIIRIIWFSIDTAFFFLGETLFDIRFQKPQRHTTIYLFSYFFKNNNKILVLLLYECSFVEPRNISTKKKKTTTTTYNSWVSCARSPGVAKTLRSKEYYTPTDIFPTKNYLKFSFLENRKISCSIFVTERKDGTLV